MSQWLKDALWWGYVLYGSLVFVVAFRVVMGDPIDPKPLKYGCAICFLIWGMIMKVPPR